jgi:hypothetical protein
MYFFLAVAISMVLDGAWRELFRNAITLSRCSYKRGFRGGVAGAISGGRL